MSFAEDFKKAINMKDQKATDVAQEGLGQEPQPKVAEQPIDPTKPQQQEPLTPEQEQMKQEILATDEIAAREASPISQGVQVVESDPNTWSPEYTQASFIQKTANSLLQGFGEQVIGGTGDILQLSNMIVGADVSSGNMASRALQEYGEELARENPTYQSSAFRQQFEDNAWNIKTAMHPDFWSTEIAKGIPMLVEFILLSKGASGLAKQGAKKALSGIAKTKGRKVIGDTTGKLARGAGKDVLGKADGVASRLVLETGELTELGSGVADFIGGGVTQNMLAGLMNSAELVNTNKDLKGPDGQPLYTEEQLASMASASFTNNMMYLPIDLLSWGVTYGQAGKKLSQGVKKMIGQRGGQAGKVGGTFTKQQSLKNSALTFGNATNPTVKALGKIVQAGAKGIPEGFEETFQETFEEWAKMKAKAKIDGTEAPDYFDFYFSKENEKTRAIAFGLGMLGGGSSEVFNMTNQVNEEAEQAFKLFDKTELLKKNIHRSDKTMKEAQTQAINEMLINNKYHESTTKTTGNVNNLEFIKGLEQNGVIDKEEFEGLFETVKHLEQAWDNAEKMNVKGKVAYAQSIMDQAQHEQFLTELDTTFNEKIAMKSEALAGDPKTLEAVIKQETAIYEKQKAIAEEAIKAESVNQAMLLSEGKKINLGKIAYLKDKEGNELIVDGLTQEKYDELYTMNDEDIFKAIASSNNAPRGTFGIYGDKLGAFGKRIWKGAEEKIKPTDQEAETEEATVEGEESQMKPKLDEDGNPILDEQGNPVMEETKVEPKQEETAGEETQATESDQEQEGVQTEGTDGETKADSKDEQDDAKGTEPVDGKNEPQEKRVKSSVQTSFPGMTVTRTTPINTGGKIERVTNVTKATNKQVADTNKSIDDMVESGTDANEIYERLTQSGVTLKATKEEVVDYVQSLIDANPKAEAKGKAIRQGDNSLTNSRMYYKDINSQESLNDYVNSTLGLFERGITAMNKMQALNGFLKKSFPGTGLRSFAVKDMLGATGEDAMGYALGSVVFLDENAWQQPEVFMHEFAHIYYSVTGETDFTKAIVNEARKNKALVSHVEKLYEDYTMMKARRGVAALGVKKGGLVTANDLMWHANNSNDPNAVMDSFDVAPIEEQTLHNEELFAFYIQGPLAKKYDGWFQPQNEATRQTKTKGFWSSLKGSVKLNDAKLITEQVSKDEFVQMSFENMLGEFRLKAKGPVTVEGRFSRNDTDAKGKQKRIDAIKRQWRDSAYEYESNIKVPEEAARDEANRLIEDINSLNQEATFSDFGEQNDNEQVNQDAQGIDYDKAYSRIQAKAGAMIEGFVKAFKSGRRKETSYTSKEYKEMKVRDFKSILTRSAIEINDPFEWMDYVLNPHDDNSEELKAFGKFLQQTRGSNKLAILRSMHLIFNNTVTYPVVMGTTNIDGDNSFGQTLNKNEHTQVGFSQKVARTRLTDDSIVSAIALIKSGNGQLGDYTRVLNSLVTDFFATEHIIAHNKVAFQNGYTDMVSFMDYYINKGLYSEIMDSDPDQGTSPLFKEFASNIAVTSRQWTSDAIVDDAKGNSTASKHLSNALSKTYDKLRVDLESGISKDDFLLKWNNLDGTNVAGNKLKIRNDYLGFVYDNFNNNKILPGLSLYVGDQNHENGKNVSYKDTDATSLYLTDVVSFLSGNGSYLTSMNTFGDSKRRIVTPMKKYSLASTRLGTQFSSEIENAYRIYVASANNRSKVDLENEGDKGVMSFGEYRSSIQKAINDRIDYFENNINELGGNELMNMFNPDTRELTPQAKKDIASHELSTIINKTNIHELITPSIPVASNIKRNKMNISPTMTLSPKMKIENVFLAKDFLYDKGNRYETNDSGQYVTEETANKIANAGKGVVDLNYGFKLINYNVERENPKFKGKALALKGYTTIITEEMANKHPEMKAIRDALVERENRIKDWADKNDVSLSEDYNDGGFDHIVIASPLSAEKGHLFNPKQLKTLDDLASIESLQDPYKQGKYHELMDSFHYNKGQFVGFDGSNLGPQMRMDMQRNTSTVPVQVASGVVVASDFLGNRKEAEEILADQNRAIEKQASEKLLKHIFEVDSNGVITNKVRDGVDLAKFIISRSDKEKINPIEKYLLSMDEPSIYNPRLTENATNQILNSIVKYMNKLEGSGTIAQQKSELAGKVNPSTGESSELSFYTQKADGSYKAMEGILPKYMEKNTRKRKYYSSPSAIRTALKGNIFLQNEFGITDETIEGFIELNKDKGGYYVPGESVLVTRVPSSGPSFTGVMEVVDFDDTGASNIMVPSEFKDIIGSDDDGDQLFVNKKSNRSGSEAYNSFLQGMMNKWLSKEMQSTLTTPLDSVEEIDGTIAEMKAELGEKFRSTNPTPFSSEWAMKNHNDALGASQTIGIGFNYHRIFNGLAAYNTELIKMRNGKQLPASVTLNGHRENKISDDGIGKDSRIQRSNTITQIILDSANNAQAEDLGLTKQTVGHAMLLTNLGFDLKTVGLFLNQPIVKDYFKRIGSKGQLYATTETQYQVLTEMSQDLKYKNIYQKPKANHNINFSNDSRQSKYETLQLIHYLNDVSANVETLNKVMKGHKSIDNDPAVIREQQMEFEGLVNGKSDFRALGFDPEYKRNGEVSRYLNTMGAATQVLSAMSILHNKSTNAFLDEMKLAFGGMDNEWATKRVTKQLQIYNEAKFLGINNNYSKSRLEDLIAVGSKNNVYNAYADYLGENYDPETGDYSSVVKENMFLIHALELRENEGLMLRGQPLAKDDSLTDEEIKLMQDGFLELPTDLQEKIIVADLVINEWKGKNSLIAFFGKDVLTRMNKNANTLNKVQNAMGARPSKLKLVRDIIINNEMNQRQPAFPRVSYEGSADLDSNTAKLELVKKVGFKNNFTMLSSLMNGANGISKPEVIVQVTDGQGNANSGIFLKIKGYSPEKYNEIRKQAGRKSLAKNTLGTPSYNFDRDRFTQEALVSHLVMDGKAEYISKKPKASYNIDLIAIKDSDVNNGLPLTQVKSVKKKDKPERLGMAYRGDFHNFTGNTPMEFDQFVNVQQHKYPVSVEQNQVLYSRYLTEKDQANALAKDYTTKKVANMSDDTLLKKYKEFGSKDIYAFSNIMVPIILELNKRSSSEQSKITGRYEDGKDVAFIKSWMQTNNIDSNHPATQAIQRQIENEFKSFTNEKKQYVRKLNDITDKLYNEKFNDKFSKSAFLNRVRRAITVMFTDRNKLYDKLYGNIIEVIDSNEEGTLKRKVRLQKSSLLRKKLDKGEITQTEFDFAETFRSIVGEIGAHRGQKDFATNGFIPAVAMSRMESFSHRGLLGLMASSHNEDDAVYDVRMTFNGKEMSFKEIKDYFRSVAPNNFNNIKEYTKIALKAKRLLSEKKNEDGSPLMMTKVANVTMLGDGMINRFASENFEQADDFQSMDLNKALYDYIHSSLFVHGNGKFGGFLKLQSLVDGLLVHNQQMGFTQQNKFVKKVYKEGFLKARTKQVDPVDNVVDTLVRGNLLYILGYKGLLLQNGAYAIGNIIAGKYHNVKNAGGKTWLNGEKRFWGLDKEGKLGFKKALGVLESLNYADFNVYDEVNMDKQSGISKIFSDVALSPMIHSEKWIQGAHFIGLLSEEQWSRFDDDGEYLPGAQKLTNTEINMIENKVKNSHGKGYSATDQRMVQQYSWGKMMMQFSRFIPTMVYDRFAKEDIDIYGQTHVGSLRLVGDVIYKMTSGEMSPKQYVAYRNSLSPQKRAILDSGLRGMAITAAASFLGTTFNLETLNEMTGDANYVINSDKLEWKIMPSTIRTIHNIAL